MSQTVRHILFVLPKPERRVLRTITFVWLAYLQCLNIVKMQLPYNIEGEIIYKVFVNEMMYLV